MKKVFVSGCFDMLHSGHVAFFEEASRHGTLYVGVGSDATILKLKGRATINREQERLYMVKSTRYVFDAWINRGEGLLDFEEDLKELMPDIFFVNEDGHTPEKEQLCQTLGIEYMISRRVPHEHLPARSTTALRSECFIPYRLDLAGGWLDQPFVSQHHPGAVLTINIEPDIEFNDRSGMATSTRKKAIELWQNAIPVNNSLKLAKELFCFENPPGTRQISGSQDALGIVLPGLNKLEYHNDYWPYNVVSVQDEDILQWIEDHLCMVALAPRHDGYEVLANTNITPEKVQKLSKASENCWEAILRKDLEAFGKAMSDSFNAQLEMFPLMISPDILKLLEDYKPFVHGWKLSGAGGGGYFIFVVDHHHKITGTRVRIRKNLKIIL